MLVTAGIDYIHSLINAMEITFSVYFEFNILYLWFLNALHTNSFILYIGYVVFQFSM